MRTYNRKHSLRHNCDCSRSWGHQRTGPSSECVPLKSGWRRHGPHELHASDDRTVKINLSLPTIALDTSRSLTEFVAHTPNSGSTISIVALHSAQVPRCISSCEAQPMHAVWPHGTIAPLRGLSIHTGHTRRRPSAVSTTRFSVVAAAAETAPVPFLVLPLSVLCCDCVVGAPTRPAGASPSSIGSCVGCVATARTCRCRIPSAHSARLRSSALSAFISRS